MSMVDTDMTIGHAPVTSLLTERPPEEHLLSQLPSQPRAPQHASNVTPLREEYQAPGPQRYDMRHEEQYEVVYDDAQGKPLLAFSTGQWFDVTSFTPKPISVRAALRCDPAWAGAVVQTVCLWMRSHPDDERSFDLATELALAVGELARQLD